MFFREALEHVLPGGSPAPQPYTLPHIIAWLEGKDPNESYDWESCRTCLLARYAVAQGFHQGDYGEGFNHARNMLYKKYGADGCLITGAASAKPWTFGAALERARALAAGATPIASPRLDFGPAPGRHFRGIPVFEAVDFQNPTGFTYTFAVLDEAVS